MLGKRKVRKNVFELVFGYNFNLEKDYIQYYNEAVENGSSEDDENESVKTLFYGICENVADIDAIISANLKKWSISRLSKVALSILRVSVYEMKYTALPPAIAINEAVELAKQYAEDGAAAYINGVLNNIKSGL